MRFRKDSFNQLLLVALPLMVLAGLVQAAEPGVRVSFASQGVSDVRVQRMAALYVAKDAVPTPFVAASDYSVEFSGMIQLEARSRLYFSFGGKGKATLSVNGEVVLEASGDDLSAVESSRLRLNAGSVPVLVTYEPPADGDTEFRLYWRGREFHREVIPPSVWQHEADEATAKAEFRREGREWFAKMKCASCHLPETEFGETAMPELLESAPSLKWIAETRDAGWVNAWLKGPRILRPQARMPHLFKKGERTEDVAAWVMTQGEAAIEDMRAGDKAAGGVLFRDAGCIACHLLPGAEPDEAGIRLPLKWVTAKFNQGAIIEFLKNPAQGNPHTRMPDFGFTEKECMDLAAFVLSLPGMGKRFDYQAGDPVKGAAVVKTLGCVNCHSSESGERGIFPTLKTIAGTDWLVRGCVAGVGKRIPNFSFTAHQKKVLAAFGGKAPASLSHRVSTEYASRTLEDLNCNACHMMDGKADGRSLHEGQLGDLVKGVHEGGAHHVDQSRPSLSYVGEKLNADWTRKLLNGELDYKPREWLAARMPAWKSRSGLLATGLAHMHGVSAETADALKVDAELLAAGTKLVGVDGGFACQACHAMGEAKAIALFEVAGNNLAYTSERLRYEYFVRWMHNPMRVNPNTRMPQFIGNDGASPMLDIFEGNGARQIEAIWHWLQTGRALEAPPVSP